jgi:hypothetical protein
MSKKAIDMLKSVKRKLKDSYIFDTYSKIRSIKHYWDWIRSGRPVPPPHTVKRMTVLEYASKFNIEIFVETGTYLGDMVYAVRNSFKEIYSIELDLYLYNLSKERFAKFDHIHIINGDSSKELKNVIGHTSGIYLFWLDGHYSGDITAKGQKETPIIEELDVIFGSGLNNNVILIDDARCFTGDGDYPTIEQLQEIVLNKCNECVFSLKHDIIRIHKRTRDDLGTLPASSNSRVISL